MNSLSKDLQTIIKTVIDYSISIICLILMVPVILILAKAIKISGKGFNRRHASGGRTIGSLRTMSYEPFVAILKRKFYSTAT